MVSLHIEGPIQCSLRDYVTSTGGRNYSPTHCIVLRETCEASKRTNQTSELHREDCELHSCLWHKPQVFPAQILLPLFKCTILILLCVLLLAELRYTSHHVRAGMTLLLLLWVPQSKNNPSRNLNTFLCRQ